MLSLRIFFVLLWILFHVTDGIVKPVTDDKETTITSSAIHKVVEEFYVKQNIPFDIFVINGQSDVKVDNFEAKTLLESETGAAVLTKFLTKPSNFAYRLSTNQALKSKFEISKSKIFFTRSCQDFQDIHYDFMLASQFSQNFKFLTYIHNCDYMILEQNIKLFIQQTKLTIHRGLIESFEVLLVNDGKFLYLASIEWFSSDTCNHPHLKILNIFNKSIQKWNHKLLNYQKHQNYYGCELVMLLYNRSGGEKWGSYQSDPKTNSIQPFGLTPEIFILMSKKFNFVPYFQPGNITRPVSIFQESNTATLIRINRTIKVPNVCFEVIRFSDNIKVTTQSTASFLEVRDIILVTPGELYSPFEKLFLPFDDWTWQLIVLTFLTAFVAIFVINRLPKIFQMTIYGENVTTPVLNVVSSFFGISQVKLPGKNFPRFILIMFVLFCLIFRTCYQSKLFEFMTSEPRRPPPKSVDDLIERNYTMYVPLHFAAGGDLTEDEKWPNMEIVDIDEYSKIFRTQSQNSSARIAMSMQTMMMDHYEWMTGDPKFWLQIPDTTVQVSHVGFSMFSNNFFLQGLNDVTQQLVMTGIMDKTLRDLFGTKRKFSKLSEPKILSLENLGFGFVIWLWFCGICVLVFLCEISIGNFKKVVDFSEVLRITWQGIVACVDVKKFKEWFRFRKVEKQQQTVKAALKNVTEIFKAINKLNVDFCDQKIDLDVTIQSA